jgi:6-phosphogluconolactonase (cycloisomerase 2 family)
LTAERRDVTVEAVGRPGWIRERVAVSTVVALVVLGAGAASGATGDLSYLDCTSGEAASAGCTQIAAATADGQSSGLAGLSSIEASADGRSVYVASRSDDGVAHFQRNRNTGALSYVGCISGEAESAAACDQLPGAGPGGNASGLSNPDDLGLSPDGRSVYVAADGDDAVSHLRRNRQTGALSFAGCISGNDGVTSCTRIPDATPDGTNSGLNGLDGVGVSPDGKSVYVISDSDANIARFRRNADGSLNYRGCIGADSDTPCQQLPGAVPGGSDTGFDSLRELALSPDGRSLYTVSDSDEAVGEFRRNQGNGALSFRRCVTGATSITNCTPIPGATPNGEDTGLRSIVHVDVSPDGNSVYTGADSDEAVAHFDRAKSGALTFRGCFTGESGPTLCTPVPGATPTAADSGMDSTVWVEVGSDARTVYVAGASDTAINSFRRNPRSGELTALGCLSGETEATPCTQLPGAAPAGADTGFDDPRSITTSPDGASLYAAANDDAAVSRFDREPDADGPKLKAKARKRQRGRKVVVKATCRDELCAKLVAKGKLKAGGKRAKLKKAKRTDVRAGDRTKLKLRLSGKARKALGKAGRGKAKLKIVGRDLLGNRTKRTAKVALRG